MGAQKTVRIGNILIGGGNMVAVQTMCNTLTTDIDATVRQINMCAAAGCDLIRVAVPNKESAQAIHEIKKQIDIPLIADIHFDYRLAVLSTEAGADKIRINPGNLPTVRLREVVDAARERGIPVRVGVNGGSLKKYSGAASVYDAQSLVRAAEDSVRMIEELNYDNIVVAVKSSNVAKTVTAYRLLNEKSPYPLHLGVTEAGTIDIGLAKSYAALGSLLLDGIGDTIRISLTTNPVEEVAAAKRLLKAIGLDKNFVEVISCPTCARAGINVEKIASEIVDFTKDIRVPLSVAVMGCIVNGPGEASAADVGIAGGEGRVAVFKKGKIIKTVNEENAIEALKEEIRNLLA